MKEQPAIKKKNTSLSSFNALFGFSVIVVAVAYFYLHPSDKVEESKSADGQESEDDQGLPLFSAQELGKYDGISK